MAKCVAKLPENDKMVFLDTFLDQLLRGDDGRHHMPQPGTPNALLIDALDRAVQYTKLNARRCARELQQE